MYANQYVKDIVLNDYRTADVMRKWGINYCCGGNALLSEICAAQDLKLEDIQAELEAATRSLYISTNTRFDEWPLDFLLDYILNVHHAYLKQSMPQLKLGFKTFVEGHIKKYPYLIKSLEIFEALTEEIEEHSKDEEERVFPYIRQIYFAHKRRESYGKLFVRTLGKSLDAIIKSDHRRIISLLLALRKETNGYKFDKDVCTNHQVIYHKLKEFDNDIVQHKHLENNILFPKAIQIEKELLLQ